MVIWNLTFLIFGVVVAVEEMLQAANHPLIFARQLDSTIKEGIRGEESQKVVTESANEEYSDWGHLKTGIPGLPHRGLHSIPIVVWNNIQYFTGMTIGTPPQPFRALLDISSPDTFVPSSTCKGSYGLCNGHFQYNGDWSRTVNRTGKVVLNSYPGLYYQAVVTGDALTIGGLEIENQQFLEGMRVSSSPFVPWLEDWDAVIGFAPDDENSAARLQGPWTRIAQKQVVKDNILSVYLGRYDPDWGMIPGEMILGGVNEELLAPNTSMVFIPMSNNTDPPDLYYPILNSTWQVPADSVAFTWFNRTSGENMTFRADLPSNGTARFDTIYPQIALPRSIVRVLDEIAKPRGISWFILPGIECSKMAILPDLVFTLAGEDFILRPDDYVMQSVATGEYRCLWPFTWSPDVFEDDFFLLGSPFMRGFYMAFDLDSRNIGFGTHRWRASS